MGEFDKKAHDFQEKVMKAAREDMSTKGKEQAEFENFPIDVSLQQGSPGNYIVNVRNNSERDVTVETIQILRGDDVGECPLTEAAKAKPNDDWKVGPRSGKQLYWGRSMTR